MKVQCLVHSVRGSSHTPSTNQREPAARRVQSVAGQETSPHISRRLLLQSITTSPRTSSRAIPLDFRFEARANPSRCLLADDLVGQPPRGPPPRWVSSTSLVLLPAPSSSMIRPHWRRLPSAHTVIPLFLPALHAMLLSFCSTLLLSLLL